MLSQTKEQIQLLINKVQVLDFVLNTLNLSHEEYKEEVTKQFKQATVHKLKLTAEILRMNNAESVDLASI